MGDDNIIVGEWWYTSTDNDFNPELLMDMCVGYLKGIENSDYSKIMNNPGGNTSPVRLLEIIFPFFEKSRFR